MTDEALLMAPDGPAADPEVADRPVAARTVTLTAAGVAWVVVAAAFVGLRLAAAWTAPVAGVELVHLSGAWAARVGEADPRFAPTLFQGLSALLLHFSASEVPSRLLACLATATVPLAVYLLRWRLGDAGALVTLVFLALDAPALALGAQASAMGFDLALCCWFLVLAVRPDLPGARAWGLALAGFAAVTAGALVVPVLGGIAAVALASRQRPTSEAAGWAAGGVAVGLAAASLRFGLGWDQLRVPPLDLFSASYSEYWSTATAFQVVLLYGVPILAFGGWAGVMVLREAARRGHLDGLEPWALGWVAASGLWWVTSAGEHSTAAAGALTTALAFLAGPAVARGLAAMYRADWSMARFLLPAAGLAALIAFARVMDWGRTGNAGDPGEQVVVLLLLAIAVAALGIVAAYRVARPTLMLAAVVVLLPPLAAGSFRVATGAEREPIASPASTAQARELRAVALAYAASNGGPIVVHPSLRDAITWPFRDSGQIVVASRAEPGAAVAILPAGSPAPPDMVALEGQWALTQEVQPPDSGFLRFVRWYIDRNAVDITSTGVAVYLGTNQ